MHGQVSKFRFFRRRSVRVGLEKRKDDVERSAGGQGNVYGISTVRSVGALHGLRAIFDDGTNDGLRSIQSTCLMDWQARPFAPIGCQFRLDPVGLIFSQRLVSNRRCNGRVPLFLHDIAGQFAEAIIKHCLIVFHGEGDEFFAVFFAVFGSFGGYGHCVACFHELGDGRFVRSRNLHSETLRGTTSKIRHKDALWIRLEQERHNLSIGSVQVRQMNGQIPILIHLLRSLLILEQQALHNLGAGTLTAGHVYRETTVPALLRTHARDEAITAGRARCFAQCINR
mmetsp:Transcript_30467/g.44791  ORF Transcript_30467/g.44791 Transcript_30467/m.44791 type:complete len:283 (-) Transcript_30467:1126-1974(-)